MNSEEKIKEELFLKGIDSFNNRLFYDAHEYWEDLWTDYRLKDAKFVQGLIQLSVGYFHITNLNINGACGLLNKCLFKFELYRPRQRDIDIENIIISVEKSLQNLDNINDVSDFDWSIVPKITIDE